MTCADLPMDFSFLFSRFCNNWY